MEKGQNTWTVSNSTVNRRMMEGSIGRGCCVSYWTRRQVWSCPSRLQDEIMTVFHQMGERGCHQHKPEYKMWYHLFLPEFVCLLSSKWLCSQKQVQTVGKPEEWFSVLDHATQCRQLAVRDTGGRGDRHLREGPGCSRDRGVCVQSGTKTGWEEGAQTSPPAASRDGLES